MSLSSNGSKEIFEIARTLSSLLDVDGLVKRIGAAAEQLLGAEASSILLLDEDKQTLSFKVASSEKGKAMQKMKVKIGEGIAGKAAQDRKPVMANDIAAASDNDNPVDRAPGGATRSILCAPMIAENTLIGVIEAFNKKDGGFTAEDLALLENLASLAAISINNARMSEDQRNFSTYTMEIIIAAIESRAKNFSGHCRNVAQVATFLGKTLGMDGQEYKDLYYGAVFHDIGFIGIQDELVLSQGVMTIRARDPETNHPRVGAEMVKNINILKGAGLIIQHHHEYYDGTGFPDGLAGDAIPLGARIVAVSEAVDEMRMGGFDDERVHQMLKLGQETRFDPEIVALYLKEFADTAV